jgi:integral membrane sensor domain MASE1
MSNARKRRNRRNRIAFIRDYAAVLVLGALAVPMVAACVAIVLTNGGVK